MYVDPQHLKRHGKTHSTHKHAHSPPKCPNALFYLLNSAFIYLLQAKQLETQQPTKLYSNC